MSTEDDYSWLANVTAPQGDVQLSPFAPGYVPPTQAPEFSGPSVEDVAEAAPPVALQNLIGGGYYYAPQPFVMPMQAPMMYYPAPQHPQMVAVQTPGGYMLMPMPAQQQQQQQQQQLPPPPPPPPAYQNQQGNTFGAKAPPPPPPKYQSNNNNNNNNNYNYNNHDWSNGGHNSQSSRSGYAVSHHHSHVAPRGGRGGNSQPRVPYHPVIFPNQGMKSPPQTTVTVVKVAPGHRGAKGLIPIDGFDDEYDAQHQLNHNDSTHSNPYDVSPNNASLMDAPAVAESSGNQVNGDQVTESPSNVSGEEVERGGHRLMEEDVRHPAETVDQAAQMDTETESAIVQPLFSGIVDDRAVNTVTSTSAESSADGVLTLVQSSGPPTTSAVDEAPESTADVVRSVEAVVSPPSKGLTGPRPPVALGIDGDGSILPRPAAPSSVGMLPPAPPSAMGSNPANPIFVIPARCTSKNTEGRTTFKCPYCSQQGFLSEYVLRSHLRAKHTSDASFLVRSSLVQSILPYLRDFLAVDGPVSGGSASVVQALEFLPQELRADIRDATHFEAITTKDDDFVVFEYTPEELVLHRITSDIAVAGELRIALIDAPYVRRDTDRSVGVEQ
jgi:hypothetical protein